MINGKKGFDCFVSMVVQIIIFFGVLPFCFMQASIFTFLFGLIILLVDIFYIAVSFDMFKETEKPKRFKSQENYRKK